MLLPETFIDTLNLKACLFAISKSLRRAGNRVPVMASGTFDKAGATFVSGQSIEAFWNAVSHFPLLVGRHELRARPRHDAAAHRGARDVAATRISCYPNAGLPNEMGQYDLGPDGDGRAWSASMPTTAGSNIVGGCCGTTPDHIAAIARRVAGHDAAQDGDRAPLAAAQRHAADDAAPRKQLHDDRRADERHRLEEVRATDSRQSKYEEAVEVARQQVDGGRQRASTSTWTTGCSTAKRR